MRSCDFTLTSRPCVYSSRLYSIIGVHLVPLYTDRMRSLGHVYTERLAGHNSPPSEMASERGSNPPPPRLFKWKFPWKPQEELFQRFFFSVETHMETCQRTRRSVEAPRQAGTADAAESVVVVVVFLVRPQVPPGLNRGALVCSRRTPVAPREVCCGIDDNNWPRFLPQRCSVSIFSTPVK